MNNSREPLSSTFAADQQRFKIKNSQPDFIMLNDHQRISTRFRNNSKKMALTE